MTTLPYDEWSEKEQTELENIHKEHLAKLKADDPIHRKYEAVSEEYKKRHLAHIKQYSSTASSRGSKL